MTALGRIEAAAPAAEPDWRRQASIAAGLCAVILAIHWRDAVDIVRIWIDSSTFNHCALILPLCAWMVRQRWPELRQLAPALWPPALLLIAGAGLLWLLGDAAGVAIVRHVALLALLESAMLLCFGIAVARAVLFPLAFAWFAVPFGEELVPPMQTLTAWLTMGLLNLAGVPAHLEGVFITIPNGYFEVAEACAGVKFLIAMVAIGALVANQCFRSSWRRVAFMAAAILIPILANGVRAFATVYVAHRTSAVSAAGFDHVVYGGIFFAIVVAATMAAGWPFFDRRPDDPWLIGPARPDARAGRVTVVPVAAAAGLLVAAPTLWSAAIAASAGPVPAVDLPAVAGWQQSERAAGRQWRPHFAGADRIALGHYTAGDGSRVDLAVAVFARQAEGRELVGFGQGAAAPDGDWAWTSTGPAPAGGRLDRLASHGQAREVASFYRVGDRLTGSPLEVKLETARVRLLGGPQHAVAILVSAAAPAEGMSPRPAIDRFVAALGDLEALADRAAGLPQGR